VELYLHSSNTPSWRGAQKHRGSFTFTFNFKFTFTVLSDFGRYLQMKSSKNPIYVYSKFPYSLSFLMATVTLWFRYNLFHLTVESDLMITTPASGKVPARIFNGYL
jgi:hypothetical protein